MEKVAVEKCESYDENILEKVEALVSRLGGINNFINEGDKVVLKVNLLMGKSPDKAVTTHPELVRAVVKIIKNAGGIPIIADSPGGPFNQLNLSRGYKLSGFEKIAEEENIELNYDTSGEKKRFNRGKIKKSFTIANFINNADLVINLPKLKTHGLTKYTGAVKNLFGTIPGMLKAEYHLNLQRIDHFSDMLVDLALLINADLTIMDAVTGMEGNGPSGGKSKNFGYLLSSTSPFAVDVAGTYLMGISPQRDVPTISAASERNIVSDISDIEIIGDKINPKNDTKIPEIEKTSNLIDQKLPEPLSNIAAYFLRPRPIFDHDKCVGCGECVESCPADTIILKDGQAVVDLNDCIRCFCCQEMCRYNAVDIKRPLLGKLFFS